MVGNFIHTVIISLKYYDVVYIYIKDRTTNKKAQKSSSQMTFSINEYLILLMKWINICEKCVTNQVTFKTNVLNNQFLSMSISI